MALSKQLLSKTALTLLAISTLLSPASLRAMQPAQAPANSAVSSQAESREKLSEQKEDVIALIFMQQEQEIANLKKMCEEKDATIAQQQAELPSLQLKKRKQPTTPLSSGESLLLGVAVVGACTGALILVGLAAAVTRGLRV